MCCESKVSIPTVPDELFTRRPPCICFFVFVLIFHVISPIQGVITTRKDLDREAPGLAVDARGRGVYTLMVDATDHGSPTQRTTATVLTRIKKFVSNWKKIAVVDRKGIAV